MTMNRKFMELAAAEALSGIRAGEGGPFGAVIVRDGKVIGKGHNRVLADHDPTMHGEVAAIRDACRSTGSHSLAGCEIYTTAEPCPMCLSAIFWAGISKIYYGCTADDTAALGFGDKEYYERIRSGERFGQELCREECMEIFREYSAIKEKELY